MRTRGIALSLLAAVVLLPSGVAQAEPVVVGEEGVVTVHAAGMPAASEPWRTLVRAELVTNTINNVWRAKATLGGAVPAGKTLYVHWTPGRQQPNGCEPLIDLTQTVTSVGSDSTVYFEREIQPGYFPETPSPALTCLEVSVWSDGVVSDRLAGSMAPYSYEAGAQARPAAPLRVAAGRTTPVLLMVTSHVRATSSVTVSGSGPGVHMKDLTLGPVPADQTVPVVAKIRAPGVADSELALTARDDHASTSFDQSWEIRAREIQARRPLPGNYRSAGDGSVQFRVTDDHRVVRLRTSAVLCERSRGTRVTYPVELHLPRSGATAEVTQLGSRWFGAQLLTRKPGRVQGVFVYTTATCQMSLRFVATRER